MKLDICITCDLVKVTADREAQGEACRRTCTHTCMHMCTHTHLNACKTLCFYCFFVSQSSKVRHQARSTTFGLSIRYSLHSLFFQAAHHIMFFCVSKIAALCSVSDPLGTAVLFVFAFLIGWLGHSENITNHSPNCSSFSSCLIHCQGTEFRTLMKNCFC